MFILIKVVILSFLALVVFFVPLGSRPLAGHIRAIWATPESRELKKALTDNALMLETWIESHRALSGEPVPAGTTAMEPEKRAMPVPPRSPQPTPEKSQAQGTQRSEERRGGKECSSGWSPYRST